MDNFTIKKEFVGKVYSNENENNLNNLFQRNNA